MPRRTCTARTAKGSLYNGKKMFSEIIVLVKILLLAPATNAISECSCSTLRRIKTYLCSTMIQSWLSHCMMFNAHKEALGELSLIERANDFGGKLEQDWTYFEKLVRSRFLSILSWRCPWQHRLSNIFHCFLILIFSLTKYIN